MWRWRGGDSPECGWRLMGAIISMPKTLSDEESLPGDGPWPIHLRRSGHLPGSEPTYGRCLCCCGGGGEGSGRCVCGGSGGVRLRRKTMFFSTRFLSYRGFIFIIFLPPPNKYTSFHQFCISGSFFLSNTFFFLSLLCFHLIFQCFLFII